MLTPEALAEKLGETLSGEDDTGRAGVPLRTELAAVLLAVDVGNTQTVFGLFDGERLVEHWRVATEDERTADELRRSSDACSSSASSASTRSPASASRPPSRSFSARTRSSPSGTWGRRCSSSGRGSRPGSRSCTTTRARSAPTGSRTPSPRASATARPASSSTSAPRRTSTPSPRPRRVRRRRARAGNRDLDGRALARGRAPSEGRLHRAADVIGKTTTSALQSGLVYGFAGQVDGIVGRMRAELGDTAPGRRDRGPRRADRAALAKRSSASTRFSRSRASASFGTLNQNETG